MLKLRNSKTVEEKGWEKTLRESDFGGLVEKERGKGDKTKITAHHTPGNKCAPVSTIGICNELFCLLDLYACIYFYGLLLFHFL